MDDAGTSSSSRSPKATGDLGNPDSTHNDGSRPAPELAKGSAPLASDDSEGLRIQALKKFKTELKGTVEIRKKQEADADAANKFKREEAYAQCGKACDVADAITKQEYKMCAMREAECKQRIRSQYAKMNDWHAEQMWKLHPRAGECMVAVHDDTCVPSSEDVTRACFEERRYASYEYPKHSYRKDLIAFATGTECRRMYYNTGTACGCPCFTNVKSDVLRMPLISSQPHQSQQLITVDPKTNYDTTGLCDLREFVLQDGVDALISAAVNAFVANSLTQSSQGDLSRSVAAETLGDSAKGACGTKDTKTATGSMQSRTLSVFFRLDPELEPVRAWSCKLESFEIEVAPPAVRLLHFVHVACRVTNFADITMANIVAYAGILFLFLVI